jgi:hypothetical protein
VARNKTNTFNKLRVVYDCIILLFYTIYIDHIKHNGIASLKNPLLSHMNLVL